jgi:hypothetical protein
MEGGKVKFTAAAEFILQNNPFKLVHATPIKYKARGTQDFYI